jgi:N-acetylmuramoyl-L-alanine amidase
MNTLVAICIGHSRKINGHPEGGAVTHDGATNEWNWNKALADEIAAWLHKHRVRSVIIDEYEGSSYGSAQRWLASHLRGLDVTLALELHFNSSDNAEAHGAEWLHWHSSTKGKRLADSLRDEMALTGLMHTRGTKPRGLADRGAEFLRGTHCPAVICEPFFGSSFRDWPKADREKSRLAIAMAEGVLGYFD